MYSKMGNHHGREKKPKNLKIKSKIIMDNMYKDPKIISISPIPDNSNQKSSKKIKKDSFQRIFPGVANNVNLFSNNIHKEFDENLERPIIKEEKLDLPDLNNDSMNIFPSRINKRKCRQNKNLELNMNFFQMIESKNNNDQIGIPFTNEDQDLNPLPDKINRFDSLSFDEEEDEDYEINMDHDRYFDNEEDKEERKEKIINNFPNEVKRKCEILKKKSLKNNGNEQSSIERANFVQYREAVGTLNSQANIINKTCKRSKNESNKQKKLILKQDKEDKQSNLYLTQLFELEEQKEQKEEKEVKKNYRISYKSNINQINESEKKSSNIYEIQINGEKLDVLLEKLWKDFDSNKDLIFKLINLQEQLNDNSFKNENNEKKMGEKEIIPNQNIIKEKSNINEIKGNNLNNFKGQDPKKINMINRDYTLEASIKNEKINKICDKIVEYETFLAEFLICPISQVILNDPVLADDGHTYERRCIVEWFKKSDISPITNSKLNSKELKPNFLAKSQIAQIKAKIERLRVELKKIK